MVPELLNITSFHRNYSREDRIRATEASINDDAPSEEVSLPFLFPFFDETKSRLGISPNGHLHFSVNPPCCSDSGLFCAFGGSGCGIDGSTTAAYRDLIAVFVTDLNPAASTSANVYYFVDDDGITVEWENIGLFTYPTVVRSDGTVVYPAYDGYVLHLPFTFSATLLRTGEIITRYDTIHDPRYLPGAYGPTVSASRDWFVGLRHAKVSPQYADDTNRIQWAPSDLYSGNFYGIYPPMNDTRNSSTGVYIPEYSICVPDNVVLPLNSSVLLSLVFGDGSLSHTNNYVCHFREVGPNGDGLEEEGEGGMQSGGGADPRLFVPIDLDSFSLFSSNATWNETTNALQCQSPVLPDGVNLTLELQVSYELLGLKVPMRPLEKLLLNFGTHAGGGAGAVSMEYGDGLCLKCNSISPEFASTCYRDCNLDWLGTAFVDGCGDCVGGNTGRAHLESMDCNGECFGPFTESVSDSNSTICSCRDNNTALTGTRESACFTYSGDVTGRAQLSDSSPLCISPRYGWEDRETTVSFAGREDVSLFAGILIDLGLGASVGGEDPVNDVFFANFSRVRVPCSVYLSDPNEVVMCQSPPIGGGQVVPIHLEYLNGSRHEQVEQSHAYFSYLATNDSRLERLNSSSSDAVPFLCEDCFILNGSYCVVDCNGSVRGSAVIDDCGDCSGGTTGLEFNRNLDCKGICGGPFLKQDETNLCYCAGDRDTCREWVDRVVDNDGAGIKLRSRYVMRNKRDNNHNLFDDVFGISGNGVSAVPPLYHRLHSSNPSPSQPHTSIPLETRRPPLRGWGGHIDSSWEENPLDLISKPTSSYDEDQRGELFGLDNIPGTGVRPQDPEYDSIRIGEWVSAAFEKDNEDVHFHPIALPFSVPFFGIHYRSVFVSPAGAIHFRLSNSEKMSLFSNILVNSTYLSCAALSAFLHGEGDQLPSLVAGALPADESTAMELFQNHTCSDKTGGSNMLAPLWADFNPFASDTVVRYRVVEDALTVHYSAMSFWSTLPESCVGDGEEREVPVPSTSFAVHLFSNGSFLFGFDDVEVGLQAYKSRYTSSSPCSLLPRSFSGSNPPVFLSSDGSSGIVNLLGGIGVASFVDVAQLQDESVSFGCELASFCIAPQFTRFDHDATFSITSSSIECLKSIAPSSSGSVGSDSGSSGVFCTYGDGNLVEATLVEDPTSFSYLSCRLPPAPLDSTVVVSLVTNSTSVGLNADSVQDEGLYPLSEQSSSMAVTFVSPFDSAIFDDQSLCGKCSSFNDAVCDTDCFGTPYGLARVDDCGVCSGGLTTLNPNADKDCSGICFGTYGAGTVNSNSSVCQCLSTTSDASTGKLLTDYPPEKLSVVGVPRLGFFDRCIFLRKNPGPKDLSESIQGTLYIDWILIAAASLAILSWIATTLLLQYKKWAYY